MSTQPKPSITPEEYLAAERQSETKHEYFHGEVFAMGGASVAHVRIVANLVRHLGNQLEGSPCEALPSDLRVRVSRTGLYTYPDVLVVCDEMELDDDHKDTLLNPRMIIEVLSPSTESYDRGKKFGHYRTIESLAEYVLVSQESPRIEQFTRRPDNDWLLHTATALDDSITFTSIDCKLKLADIYTDVEFPESNEPTTGQV